MLKVLPVDVERHAHVTGDPSPDRPTNVVYSVEGSDIAPAVNIGDGGPPGDLVAPDRAPPDDFAACRAGGWDR